MATTASVSAPAAKTGSDGRTAPYSQLPKWLFPALFAAEVLAYWLTRATRGFWIDEATTYWIDLGGWSHAWTKLKDFPAGQSFLYQSLAMPFVSDGPFKEALLRIPSIAGMLLAAWLLYKLTESILGDGFGWPAVTLFTCAGAIVETATNARPYALGLAVVLASFWSLREYLRTRKATWLAFYCVSSALVVYFHYAFVLIFLVQGIYLAAAARSLRTVPWLRMFAAGCFIAAAAIPLAWQMSSLVRQAKTWSSAAKPTILDFFSFFPIQVLLATAVGLLLFYVLHREWFGPFRAIAFDDRILLLTWALLGPAVMFLIDRTSSLATFTTRYLIYALPPCFMLLAWCIGHLRNEAARFVLVLSVALNSAMYVRNIGANTPEWRTPLQVAEELGGAATPIILPSAHADAVGLDWPTEPNSAHHYYAQLAAYPIPNKIIPAPFFMDAGAERFLKQEIAQLAPTNPRFCLVADKNSEVLGIVPNWFRERGYKISTQDVGGIEVVLAQLN